MSCQLLTDCLNEVFEILEDDKKTLHSCLLVNRLWCGVSVRILWRSFKFPTYHEVTKSMHNFKLASAILSTLIACLPNESKELLHINEIFISKPPLFNYAAFCKVLSINEIVRIINDVFRNEQCITSQSREDRNRLITKEIIKMFMNQISSLKKLTYYLDNVRIPGNILLPNWDCSTNLSKFGCSSNVDSEFFRQLSQVCHNLQSLTIDLNSHSISKELKELISLQNNLKSLNLLVSYKNGLADIIPSLTKHRNTLIKLQLYSEDDLPLSFISLFSNLQEINLLFTGSDFTELRHASFPKLQTLKFPYRYPTSTTYIIQFLEINGKHLEEFYIHSELGLSITKFCHNLKRLFILFKDDELDVLKTIFNSCQHLESIKIWCGVEFLNEKEVLEVVANHSPKNFYELILYNNSISVLLPEDLESFFISWKNRTSKRSLSLIILKEEYGGILNAYEDNMEIIEKYINLGVIKKFVTKDFIDEDEEERGIALANEW